MENAIGTLSRSSGGLRGEGSLEGVLQEENRVFGAIFVQGFSFPSAHVYSDDTECMYGKINCRKRNEAEGNTKRHSESVLEGVMVRV